MLGVEQQGQDDYIGWYNLSIEELFSYTWAIDASYFFTLDSALMIASKGGLSINILNKMGIRTKKQYLDALQEIHRQMNGTGGETKDAGNTDYNVPDNVFTGG